MLGLLGRTGPLYARPRTDESPGKSGERIRAAFDHVAHGILTIDQKGTVVSSNPAARKLFGYDEDQLAGLNVRLLILKSHVPEFTAHFLASLRHRKRQPAPGAHHTMGRRKDGTTFPMEFLAAATRLGGEQLCIATVRDISEQLAETQALKHQALHDPLTGLPNRTFLSDRLEQAILAGEREQKPRGLLLMDMDGFKEVNDTLGHAVGDRLLQEVAARLGWVLRKADTVARLGGDEFAVLPAGTTDATAATTIAGKILSALQEPVTIEGQPVELAASIGVAIYPEHGSDADTLLRRADAAMYVAKRAGTGCALSPAPDRPGSRPQVLRKLRSAIDNVELVLHYQPLVDLRTRRTPKVEALVRWGHPSYGLLPPDQFIPSAEQSDLILPLTQWVLTQALGQLRAWQAAGLELGVAVNLSARNLQDDELPGLLAEMLRSWDVEPGALTLEITERTLLAPEAETTLQRLREIGTVLAVDDFGTGYSSLAKLRTLPVNEVKIDKTFVGGMVISRDDATIVRSTIDLVHNLGLGVVAEGVETPEVLHALVEAGCDLAQGYVLSRPLPAGELSGWMRDGLASAT